MLIDPHGQAVNCKTRELSKTRHCQSQ